MPTQYLAFRNTCCYTSQISHKPDVINQLANHHQPAFLPKLFFHQFCICSFTPTSFYTSYLLHKLAVTQTSFYTNQLLKKNCTD